MGYQESWLYIEPQHKFKKLIQAYEKAEQSGYYIKNVLILFFIQRTEKRSLGGECHALPI